MAASPVADLQIRIAADVARLQTDLAAAQARVQRFGQTVANQNRPLREAGQAANGTRIQFANFGNQIQDIVVQVSSGTSVIRALTQQLPQLAGGFGPVGVAIGTVIALLGALGGGLLATIEPTKKSKEQLALYSETLQAVNERLRTNIELSAQRSGETKSTATSGLQLLIRDEQQNLDKLLASRESQLKKFQDLADKFNEGKLSDKQQNIIDALDTQIAGVTKRIGDYEQKLKDVDDTSKSGAVRELTSDLQAQADALVKGTREAAIFKAVTADLAKVDQTRATASKELVDQLTALETKIYDQTKANQALDSEVKKDMRDQIALIKERIRVATDLATKEEAEAEKARDRGRKLIDNQINLGNAYKQEFESNQALISALAQGNEAYQIQSQYLQILQAYRKTGLPLIGEEKDRALELAAALVEQQRTLQSLQAANDDLNQSLNTLAEGFAAAADGSIDWQKVTLAALNAVSDAIIKLTELDTGGQGGIAGLLSGLLGSLFGGAGGGGGGVFPGVPTGFALAGGGKVAGNSIHLVGENGPELFVPDTSGTVIANDALMGARSGGAGLVVNINAPGADAAQLRRVEQSVRDLHRSFETRVDARVLDQRRRGGKYADAFAA